MVDRTVAESSPNPEAADETTEFCFADWGETQLEGDDGLTNF
jgi:hypothetical protein